MVLDDAVVYCDRCASDAMVILKMLMVLMRMRTGQ